MSRKTSKSEKKQHLPLRKRLLYAGVAMLLLFSSMSLLLGLHYASYTSSNLLQVDESKTVVIPHNTNWPRVVDLLHIEGVIKRPLYFQVWARRRDLPRRVRAGTYTFTGPLTLDELGESLQQGGRRDVGKLAVPEGFTIFHIADRLEQLQIVGRSSFLEAAKRPGLLHRFDVPGESFEGYLFPATYDFHRGVSPEHIIERMHKHFLKRWNAVLKKHPERLKKMKQAYGFDAHDIIILASLIERETNYDPERGLIARVFLNRIDQGMKLQTDPTCVYGEQTYLEVPSPKYCRDRLNRYSTYVVKGLPPGPISVPGEKSLEAALSPDHSERGKKLLYFVARRDGTGSHYFSKTYKEHKAAIRKYLK
jgi:UPF0755 protein